MKKRLLAFLISFSVVAGSVYVPYGAGAAAKMKLNKTKLNLTVGKSYKLKVKNASGKIKWKTSNKKVAKVSKKGKVKALKKGKAKIWAILRGKKLKCNVKVSPAKKSTPAPETNVTSPAVTTGAYITNGPTENPSTDRPTGKPATDKPTDVPTGKPATDKPTEKPATDKPTEKPATDKPTEKPATDKPTEKPATDKPTEKPATDKPTEKPATDKPTEKPATDKPTEKPATDKPTEKPVTDKPTEKPATDKPTETPATDKPTQKPATDNPATDKPTDKPVTDEPTSGPTDEPTSGPTNKPTQPPTEKPTQMPTTRPVSIESGDYSYASDYTIGYKNGAVVAYKGSSSSMSLADAGVKVYDSEGDSPFKTENEQAWDMKDIMLTQPVKYTTEDGVSHDIESMLTNFNFIADPAAIDNSDVDGKLYVYGTTEGFTYKEGKMADNEYANHSLTILSTTDMVNWTDEGFMDSRNLTNEPSDSGNKVMGGFTSGCSWAPSGLKIDGDGDGEDEYYIFYTNGAATGYVMADSPVGPWRDPLGKALFDKSTPNCSDCENCFDPAVLVDDKGDAYVYFGGLSVTSGRACKIKFEPGTGHVLLDGAPVKLPTYFMFEDNEINQFNGLYYYSYCSNWDWENQKLTNTASICVYVSSDPLNVSFDPTTRPEGQEKEAFTDENGVYRHFLGTVLNNPSSIYGQAYNNHHHMQEFKNRMYIFYHSTVLNNTVHRASHAYRNLHVDEITVDRATDNINCTPSYEGASQIESFNPYVDFAGNVKEINATTTSYSAGVCSRRSDSRVKAGLSPMVLDEIDTGDWTKIQGVDFGTSGASAFLASVASETDDAAIEVYIDNPLSADNKIATIMVNNTGSQDVFETIGTEIENPVTGVHDVYFVFRGTGYDVASWKFESNTDYVSPLYSVTGVTSEDNEIEDFEIKYENGVYNIYITGKNEEPGTLFDVSAVDGAKTSIIYSEFTGYTKSMGRLYVDMGNYKYTYHMYYWCSAVPKPTATPSPTPAPSPTPTPEPTATPEPTPPPEMLDHYSAPYTLVFGDNTVKTQGNASYTLGGDGTVTIKVSGQYSGVSFVLPEGLDENNFDTVTVTYKDAKDVGNGFGCGLWRTGDDKDSEDVVAWGGIFTGDASGEYKASISGNETTKSWYVNKCLLFNNTNNDILSAAPATVTITSVVFSHSKYVEPGETSKPEETKAPQNTDEPQNTAEPDRTPEPNVADKAEIVNDVPSDYKELKEGVEYGEFRNISYYSDITKSNRSANVVLPPGYDESKQYPVVYMLHGIGCSKEMFGTSIDDSSIAKIFGNLRAEGKCEDMIIVFPGIRVSDEPEDDMHSTENYKHYDDFREDLINNLMPYMEENFSVKTGRENTGVCGWSMGGREALYIGLSRPELFGYVAGYCPAFGLLPYTNPAVGKSEDGLLAVEGAEEDTITLPDKYINNTFVMVCHGIWDNVVNDEPTRYHNALTTGGVPHIYLEYPSGHSDGVYDPGFYNFILNAFKLVEPEETEEDNSYKVSISKDNEYTAVEADNVTYTEDGVSFTAKSGYGGGGMVFWPAGSGKPFNLSDYGKIVVELTAENASVPMAFSMYKANPANIWGDTMSLSDSWFSTSKTAGERTVVEYDLDKVEGVDREGDLYGLGIRIRGWESDNSYNIKIHSIKFIPSEPVPELTSLKSIVDPVFGVIGTCINYSQLKQIKTVKYVAEHYSSISLENEMKPDAILGAPTLIGVDEAQKNTQDYVIPDSYAEETVPKLNFDTVDGVLRIAKERGLKLRAHTLVWHAQTPEFFFREGYDKTAAYVDKTTMNARLEMYIRSVMHHVYTLDDGAYKDVVYTWDVANEYMHNNEYDPENGKTEGNWSAVYGNRSLERDGYPALGNKPDYIKFAFETAYDCLEQYGLAGQVTLIYNDFNTYFDCQDNIIEMINYFNAEKKICDGVGMQSHLRVTLPSAEHYLKTVENFIDAGFEVQITELDLGIDPEEPEQTYEVQAEYVKTLMEGLIDIQNRKHGITGITWWGLCDAVSWRGGYSSEGNSHPLLFDKTMYDVKPAYYSFINAFNKE